MKSKLINIIIACLIITLGLLCWRTYDLYTNKQKINTKTISNIQALDKNILINKLNKENSINVLSGECVIDIEYSDNKSFQNECFQWLHNKLNGRKLNSTNTYKFVFSYELNNIPITIKNNKAIIQLSRNRLALSQVELSNIIQGDEIGLLKTMFSPNELNTLNDNTKKLAYNSIQNNADIRNKAIENLKTNIKELLNCDCEFIENSYDVINQNDLNISNIKYE
ncbi:hypothetical protein DVV91_09855 [Clostridium botulinum]|uniref:hypothetical protein n=1 Tax=Clostridium botulinum TaxID=1491 RepID=UPI0019671AAF|nr:hypothetical protein [Clostridium botulinum]MBN1074644.1 hypothetical protein [Clostridium botulinum]